MPSLFKIEIKQSQIHGMGYFAAQDIPKGTVWWVWEDPNGPIPIINHKGIQPNRVWTRQQIQRITDENQSKKILHVSFYYADGDVLLEMRDGCQWMNHSQNPNSQIRYPESKNYKDIVSYASKDIKAGDQMTESYGNYLCTQAEWIDRLMTKYYPQKKQLHMSIIQNKNKQIQ